MGHKPITCPATDNKEVTIWLKNFPAGKSFWSFQFLKPKRDR